MKRREVKAGLLLLIAAIVFISCSQHVPDRSLDVDALRKQVDSLIERLDAIEKTVGKGKEVRKVVEAEKFIVTDKDGNTRAVLGILPKGLSSEEGPGLVLLDGSKNVSAILGGDVPFLSFFDVEADPSEDGVMKARLILELLSDGEPALTFFNESGGRNVSLKGGQGLTLFDEEGKASVGLSGANSEDWPSLRIMAKNSPTVVSLCADSTLGSGLYLTDGNTVRVGLDISKMDATRLTFADRSGTPLVRLGAGPPGAPTLLVLSDKDEEMRASIILQPDGSPNISLWDKDEEVRAVLGCIWPDYVDKIGMRSESSFILLDATGKVMWSAPPGETEQQEHVLTKGKYVTSMSSDIFHKLSCYHVERIREDNKVYFHTFREARESGKRPCKICKPEDEDGSE